MQRGDSDLAFPGVQPDDLFEELRRIWDIPLGKKSKVLALTVPEAGIMSSQRTRIGNRRNRLNTLIKEYKKENLCVHAFPSLFSSRGVLFSSFFSVSISVYLLLDWNYLLTSSQTRSHTFDLHDAVPYFSMSEADRERYWDDAVHFTPDGYDLIGQKVGQALVSMLVKDKAIASPPRRRLRKFKDDDNKFVEEVGDPSDLTQGYIVVRRKDLD